LLQSKNQTNSLPTLYCVIHHGDLQVIHLCNFMQSDNITFCHCCLWALFYCGVPLFCSHIYTNLYYCVSFSLLCAMELVKQHFKPRLLFSTPASTTCTQISVIPNQKWIILWSGAPFYCLGSPLNKLVLTN